MENTIRETRKVRYALPCSALQLLKCSQQDHIRSADIHGATGLRNIPELPEKSAFNTFLLFSPSLSPDLFMFLELCLHCFAFIAGDSGCCSTRIKYIFMDSYLRER